MFGSACRAQSQWLSQLYQTPPEAEKCLEATENKSEMETESPARANAAACNSQVLVYIDLAEAVEALSLFFSQIIARLAGIRQIPTNFWILQ